ncbi:MAG: ABC transporter ATP-binding protein [Candidatus Bathyarchaeia archaeon]
MLELSKINVYYGDLQVIWDVSFTVPKGMIVAVLGPNGAGKTTILKTISGLLKPKSGTITFLGKRIDTISSYQITEYGISYVPEGRRLFPQMTVLENLEMGAYSRRARNKKSDTLERVFQLFPILKERKNQLAGTLSGGEQQMLAIGRGLMSNPLLLMLDEPSLGLAPKITWKLFEIIREINKEGLTILLVEQNIHYALELADKAYVLETGKIVLEGKGEQLLNDPYVKKAYLGA